MRFPSSRSHRFPMETTLGTGENHQAVDVYPSLTYRDVPAAVGRRRRGPRRGTARLQRPRARGRPVDLRDFPAGAPEAPPGRELDALGVVGQEGAEAVAPE